MQVPRLALPRDLRGKPRAYTWTLTSIPDVPTSKDPAWILCLKCPVVFSLLLRVHPILHSSPPNVSL